MSESKKTKIIATLGPASNSPDVMEKMILEGVDVFRIFSDGIVTKKRSYKIRN